jgi:hypothetical protein
MKRALPVLTWILFVPGLASALPDKDTDGDGLSDFAEKHKHFTDPASADSDHDGTPDADSYERREYTYSVRTVLRVMKPYDLAVMTDDYQDARLLKETQDFGEIEVVHYPLNTVSQSITANPHWQSDASTMQEWLRPGVTTNWTPDMRMKLLAELRSAGIEPDRLTDRDLAEKVSRWMLNTTKSPGYMFTTYYMDFANGKPALLKGCEERFAKDKGTMGWSFEEQLERELLGAGMFTHKTRGTCTSSAIYWTTIFRALGLPARHVLCVPAIDVNDPAQQAMIERGITHHQVRHTAQNGMEKLRGFVSHTFNEVFIGGRWVRLNYATLGQNILDEKCYGLITHTLTFHDLSDANLAATWGKRFALGQRSPELPTGNPYTALEVTERWGAHAKIANPQPPKPADHQMLTIERIMWADSPLRSEWLQLESVMQNAKGRVLALVQPVERFTDQDYKQFRRFLDAADPEFSLQADGAPEIPARITGAAFSTKTECNFSIALTKEDHALLKTGTAYRLVPKNGKDGAPKWAVKDDVTLTLP